MGKVDVDAPCAMHSHDVDVAACSCQRKMLQSTHIFMCGSSCKYFSRANHCKAHGPSGSFLSTAADGGPGSNHQSMVTFQAMVEFIEKCQPSIIVWENVDSILDEGPGTNNLEHVLSLWEPVYALVPFLTDASSWGVPQSRRRLYVIGLRSALLQCC